MKRKNLVRTIFSFTLLATLLVTSCFFLISTYAAADNTFDENNIDDMEIAEILDLYFSFRESQFISNDNVPLFNKHWVR